jgi:hypothetical protein
LDLAVALLFREDQVIDQLLEHALSSPDQVVSVGVVGGRASSVSFSTRRSAARASRSSTSVAVAARAASARSSLFTAPLCPPAERAKQTPRGVTRPAPPQTGI